MKEWNPIEHARTKVFRSSEWVEYQILDDEKHDGHTLSSEYPPQNGPGSNTSDSHIYHLRQSTRPQWRGWPRTPEKPSCWHGSLYSASRRFAEGHDIRDFELQQQRGKLIHKRDERLCKIQKREFTRGDVDDQDFRSHQDTDAGRLI